MPSKILAYKNYSKSAKALSRELGIKRIKHSGSTFVGRPEDTVINWGWSKNYLPFRDLGCTILNDPINVSLSSNKLNFFNKLGQQDWLPEFWTDPEEIPDEAFPIVCRTVLNGHSGAGIVIAASRDSLVTAPLYVKYIKKKEEYRVHVGNHQVISVQQKKRKLDHENPNWQVRNLANGFIYARSDVQPHSSVIECALDCVALLGLDFGAIDVVWNEHQQKAYVLEANTAPGLTGSTLTDYKEFFIDA